MHFATVGHSAMMFTCSAVCAIASSSCSWQAVVGCQKLISGLGQKSAIGLRKISALSLCWESAFLVMLLLQPGPR